MRALTFLGVSFLGVTIAACSGGSESPTTGDGGSSANPAGGDGGSRDLRPQAVFGARFERGTTNCQEVGDLFSVGDFENDVPVPPVPLRAVRDGEREGSGSVAIACTVKANGDAFDVNASLQLTGAQGGLFRVQGQLKTSGQGTVSATFARTGLPSYSQTDCIVTYVTATQGVAAGRVWGTVTCPNAENASSQTSCEASAQFRFENCTQ